MSCRYCSSPNIWWLCRCFIRSRRRPFRRGTREPARGQEFNTEGTENTEKEGENLRPFLSFLCVLCALCVKSSFLCLLSRICGLTPVREVVPACDKGPFPSRCRYGIRTIFWSPLEFCC